MPPKSKNEVTSPSSPSFSHNVMDQISNSLSSRRSSGNNFARFAFNIYGGNNNNNNNNTNVSPSSNQSSNPYQALANSTSTSSNSSYSRANHQFQNYNTSEYNELENSIKFLSSSEILSFDYSKIDNSIVAIGGQRLFQILRIDEELKEIVIENDLNHTVQANRSNKASAVSDLKFGYHQYCNYVAAAAISGNISLYNLNNATKVVSTLTDHSRTVNTLDFNSSQSQSYSLLSGSQDGTIKLWDLRTKSTKALLTILGSLDPVRCVKISPHVGRKIAGIFDSGVIKKYDLRNPSMPERKMNAHTGPGLSLDWHPELDYIASGGRDKQIQVWNMSSNCNDVRVPDFVINASGAVAKVQWSPQSCNGEILDSKLATCFFGDDPCVQIWSLNRKYIPDFNIDCHLSQVTAIHWRDKDTIRSSSKDKTLVQHDLRRCSKFIDNVSSYGVDWSNTNDELVFVSQDKNGFKQQPNTNTNSANNLSSRASEINMAPSYLPQSPAASSLTFTPITASPLQSYERPGLVRSATHKPQLLRNPSFQNNAPPAAATVSPYIIPVKLPLRDSDTAVVFEFLSSHYLTTVPEGMDFASVCEYNSAIASNARQFRESQTWKVIKASITWQFEQGIDYNEIDKVQRKPSDHSRHRSYASMTNSATNSELDIGSLGSHSTGIYFGISPSANNLNSVSNFAHYTSHSFSSRENLIPNEKLIENLKINDNDEEELKESKDESQEPLNDDETDDTTKPIPIKSPTKKRPSFNGYPDEPIPYAFSGSIPDYDDETKGYQSSSTGRSPTSLKSSLSSQRHDSFANSNNTWRSIVNSKMTPIHRLSRSDSKRSGKSALSRVLRDHHMDEEAIADDDDEDDEDTKKPHGTETQPLIPPWSPELLIKQLAEYNAHQGNIVMCATLALLFLAYFQGHSITRYQALDWIHSYHTILLHRSLFSTAADILSHSLDHYPVMKQKGQTETSLRFYCSHCKELISNEQSRQLYLEDQEVDFGFWYCDKCKKITGQCCYCNELTKGMTISSMPCGHILHFGCYRTWFFTEGEKCCPACAYPVM